MDRPDVDDSTETALPHAGQHRPRHHARAAKHHVDQPVPLGLGKRFERRDVLKAGIADQHVDRLPPQSCVEVFDLGCIRHIQAKAATQAGIVVGWVPAVHPVSMNAIGMAVGSAVLIVGSVVTGESRAIPDVAETWAALAYLIVIGSVVVFVLLVFVIKRWGASRAAYTLVLIPVFTVMYSVWLLDEPVTALDTESVGIITLAMSEHLDQNGILIYTSHQSLALGDARLQTVALGT